MKKYPVWVVKKFSQLNNYVLVYVSRVIIESNKRRMNINMSYENCRDCKYKEILQEPGTGDLLGHQCVISPNCIYKESTP